MNVVEKMQALADEWHCGVERNGKGHVPYIEHPRAVVAQLKAWGMTEDANPVPLAVAWGHDLVEDTRVPSEFVEAVKVTIEELKRQVGYDRWTPSAI